MVRTVMGLPLEIDILIVDDGSLQMVLRISSKISKKNFPGRIILSEREGKQGLGTAYIHGFKLALEHQYEFIFEMDCDFSHDPNDLIRLYEACADGGADMRYRFSLHQRWER